MTSLLSGAIRALYAKPYLLLVVCMLCWAGNIVVMRASAGHIPQIALSFIRWTLAALLFLPLIWPHLKKDWTAIRATFGFLLLLAVTGQLMPNQLTLLGLHYTTALNALLLQAVQPLLIALWAMILFRDRLTWLQLLGIVLSMAGVTVIVCQGRLDMLSELSINPGDVIILSSITVFGFYSALAKKRPPIHTFSFVWFTTAIGAVVITPMAAAEYAAGYRIHFDAQTVWTILYLIVFGSMIALLFFNRALEVIGPNRVAPFTNLTPVFGSALAIVFLGEEPRLYHATGYALVLIGLYAGTRR
jgi:drug/metabolite transporter (DMT)-like permease